MWLSQSYPPRLASYPGPPFDLLIEGLVCKTNKQTRCDVTLGQHGCGHGGNTQESFQLDSVLENFRYLAGFQHALRNIQHALGNVQESSSMHVLCYVLENFQHNMHLAYIVQEIFCKSGQSLVTSVTWLHSKFLTFLSNVPEN